MANTPDHPHEQTDLRALEAALLLTTGIAVEQCDVQVGGVTLHSLACGEGDPLVLIHGRGMAGALYAPILRQLAARHRVLTLDLPGWGLSEKPPFPGHTADDALAWWRDAVVAFLDSRGLDRADILGHSLGGMTALSVALAHPERVNRLILVDSAGLGTNAQLDVRLYFWLMPERLHPRLGPRLTRAMMRRNGVRPDDLSGPMFDLTHALWTQSAVVPSGGRAFNTFVNPGGVHLVLADRLKELKMPVLLIWGARDSITPYHDALVAARHLRDSQLVTFTRNGHSPFLERPDDFAGVVLTWLDGIHVRSRF